MELVGWAFIALMVMVIAMSFWTGQNVKKIHVLVNSRMTSVLNRVDQLTRALVNSGIRVPDDPDEPESEKAKHRQDHQED